MNISKEEKMKKTEDLSKLYVNLNEHLKKMIKYTNSEEDVRTHIKELKELQVAHIENRNFARELLKFDFSKLSNNILYKLVAKDVNTLSIKFINLVTLYNDDLVKGVEEDNSELINKTINEVNDFQKEVEDKMLPLVSKLKSLSK